MGDLLKSIQSASEGKPYTGDGMKASASNTDGNSAQASSVMGNPSILQHSLDGQNGMHKPMTLTAEDHSKDNKD